MGTRTRSAHPSGGVRSLRRVPPPGLARRGFPPPALPVRRPSGRRTTFWGRFRIPQTRRARASSRRAPRRWRSTSWRPDRSLASSSVEVVLKAASSSIRRVRASSWLANEESSASTRASFDSDLSIQASLADSALKPQPRPRAEAGSVAACSDDSIFEGIYPALPRICGPPCPDPTWVLRAPKVLS